MTDGNKTEVATSTPEQRELLLRLESIFMPGARRQRERFYKGEPFAGFVHYTSAESALKIIESKRVWMRNTTCMADYRELEHGFEIFQRYFADENKKKQFYQAVDAISQNLAEEAIDPFNQWWTNIRFSTYITAISEHDEREDAHRRLSMWRAFGGNTARVGAVLRIPWFASGSEALNLMISPVAYLREDEVQKVIHEVIANIQTNHEFLLTVDRSLLLGEVFTMLVAGVTCLKHEGFHEEREWRVIYSPERWPSTLMESSIEVVGGIPQIIYKLPLDSTKSSSLAELDLARIFDRLIIGPSQFPSSMYEAFVKSLKSIGVENAETRVFISGIPIRS